MYNKNLAQALCWVLWLFGIVDLLKSFRNTSLEPNPKVLEKQPWRIWVNRPYKSNENSLTHWSLVTPYGDSAPHWLRQCLVANRHHAFTWTNVDFSLIKFVSLTWKQIYN